MLVLELLRDTLCLFRLDLFACGIQRVVGFPAFRRAAHVRGSVRKRDACFGHPDEFHSLLRCDCELQRCRISKTDIFAGENNDASRDETEIFAGVKHFCQPVHRAFFIGPPHAFDKRTDRVVVRVARAIVHDRFLLNAFLGNCEGEMNCRPVVAAIADRDAGVIDPGYSLRRRC